MTAAPRGEVQALCEVIHGHGTGFLKKEGYGGLGGARFLRFHYAKVQAQTFDSGCCLE